MKDVVRTALATILVSGLAAAPAHAATIMKYSVDLTPINGIGSASAFLQLDNTAKTLQVDITASGLDAGMHLAHLHGRFSGGVAGTPINSVLPDPTDDMDGDGFVELAEALPDYGAIILNMNTIGTGSTINFSQLFDLTDPMNYGFVGGDPANPAYDIADLIGSGGMSLDLRELIVHGQNASAVGAGTPGEVDGTAGFKALLPTLGGEIGAVPEPATWLMMLLGFGAVGAITRSRRRVSLRYA